MQDAPTETSAPHDALGLGANAMALATRLFERSTAGFGIDGAQVFRSFLETGSLKTALNVSDAAIETLYARAHQQFAIGQVQTAETIFRSLCALDGSKCDFWLGLGICLRVRGQDHPALAAFETSARLAPDNAVSYFHILEAQIRREDWNAAVKAYQNYKKCRTGAEPEMIATSFDTFEKALKIRGFL